MCCLLHHIVVQLPVTKGLVFSKIYQSNCDNLDLKKKKKSTPVCHVFTQLSALQEETLCSQFSWCKFYLVSEISRTSLKINSLRLPNFPQTWRIMSSFMSHTSAVAPQWNSYLQLSKFSHFLHMQFQANNTNDFMPSSPLQPKTWNRIHGRCVHLGFLGHFFLPLAASVITVSEFS